MSPTLTFIKEEHFSESRLEWRVCQNWFTNWKCTSRGTELSKVKSEVKHMWKTHREKLTGPLNCLVRIPADRPWEHHLPRTRLTALGGPFHHSLKCLRGMVTIFIPIVQMKTEHWGSEGLNYLAKGTWLMNEGRCIWFQAGLAPQHPSPHSVFKKSNRQRQLTCCAGATKLVVAELGHGRDWETIPSIGVGTCACLWRRKRRDIYSIASNPKASS